MTKQERQPLVSILIPVYNVEYYLEKCLDTVENQTYQNLEIILVDDGSTDHSLDIIKGYAERDSRIKFFSRENRGLLPTRLQELQLCSGTYIAFMDSDDWLEINYIERLVMTALKYDADIVRCADVIEFVAERRRREYGKASYAEEIVIQREQYGTMLVPDLIYTAYYNSIHSELLKSDLINETLLDNIGTRSSVSVGEDLVINCEFYKRSSKVVFIPDRLYHYRKNPTSLMATRISVDKLEKRLMDGYLTFQAIEDVIKMFPGVKKEAYYQRLAEEMDHCVNLCFQQLGNRKLKKQAIRLTQGFVEKHKINKVDKKELQYLYCKDAKGELLRKTIKVTYPFLIKQTVKKVLIKIHANVRKK